MEDDIILILHKPRIYYVLNRI